MLDAKQSYQLAPLCPPSLAEFAYTITFFNALSAVIVCDIQVHQYMPHLQVLLVVSLSSADKQSRTHGPSQSGLTLVCAIYLRYLRYIFSLIAK